MPNRGKIIWFTGLPCSGKTTLAVALKKKLLSLGVRVDHLDGDSVRNSLCKGLGFSPEDRLTNLKRVMFVADRLACHGITVLCSFVSPRRDMRGIIRMMSHRKFIMVHVDCSLEECIRRDVKGMYAKAKAGEIPNFTGIGAPYEEPIDSDIRVNTESMDLEMCVKWILDTL